MWNVQNLTFSMEFSFQKDSIRVGSFQLPASKRKQNNNNNNRNNKEDSFENVTRNWDSVDAVSNQRDKRVQYSDAWTSRE